MGFWGFVHNEKQNQIKSKNYKHYCCIKMSVNKACVLVIANFIPDVCPDLMLLLTSIMITCQIVDIFVPCDILISS